MYYSHYECRTCAAANITKTTARMNKLFPHWQMENYTSEGSVYILTCNCYFSITDNKLKDIFKKLHHTLVPIKHI